MTDPGLETRTLIAKGKHMRSRQGDKTQPAKEGSAADHIHYNTPFKGIGPSARIAAATHCSFGMHTIQSLPTAVAGQANTPAMPAEMCLHALT
jgi:hypothetical protein